MMKYKHKYYKDIKLIVVVQNIAFMKNVVNKLKLIGIVFQGKLVGPVFLHNEIIYCRNPKEKYSNTQSNYSKNILNKNIQTNEQV